MDDGLQEMVKDRQDKYVRISTNVIKYDLSYELDLLKLHMYKCWLGYYISHREQDNSPPDNNPPRTIAPPRIIAPHKFFSVLYLVSDYPFLTL